jgi:hypothetical protein
MAYVKTLLCLANSKKYSGRCVAGREFIGGQPGDWVRPVSSREGQEINFVESMLNTGGYAQLLDVIEIHFLEPRAKDYQTENHLIDPTVRWRHVGRTAREELDTSIDQVRGELWFNGSSSRGGVNDQVPIAIARNLRGSLLLIRPDRLSLYYANRQRGPQLRANFGYFGVLYDLAVTDPVLTDTPMGRQLAGSQFPGALVCLSLGEPFNGYCYKLVAAVIAPRTIARG